MPSWKKADLSQLAGAPDAQGRPFAYVTQSVPRVLYLGQDTHIHELRLQGDWKKADLSDLAQASGSASFPFAYETGSGSDAIPRVVYRSPDGHIHELRLEGDWKKADLSAMTGATGAEGNPCAYTAGSHPVPRVVYRGEGHIHELRLEDGGWKKADLSALSGAPDATGDPFGYASHGDGGETARVVFLGNDAHIHELHLDPGGTWKRADLTAMTGAADAASGPFAYVPAGNPIPRVIYRGDDAHIHELRLEGGSWKKADLMALTGAAGAEGRPSAYAPGSQSIPRVVYRDGSGHIHELRLEGGSWKKADLTELSGADSAAGDPVGYATPSNGDTTPRVVYRAADGHIHELRLA